MLINLTTKATYLLRWYPALLMMLYVSLVILDMGAGYILGLMDGRHAQSIEQDRSCDEDYQMIDVARNQGYSSLLFPDLYDSAPFKQIAINHQIAPLGPQPESNLYYCNEGYGLVQYKTDRFGFRNKDTLWENPSDIVIIGDSFVHGGCVHTDQTVSGVLNGNGFKVFNLGTGSNSPMHYAAISKTFLKATRPKLAVTIFYPNDNIDNEETSIFYKIFFIQNRPYFDASTGTDYQPSAPLKALYDESIAELEKMSNTLNKDRISAQKECRAQRLFTSKFKNIYFYLRSHLYLKSTSTLLGNFLKGMPPTQKQIDLPFGSKLAIDTLKATCNENHCTPLVVYIPNSKYWRPDSRADNYELLLKQYSLQADVDFISMSEGINSIGMNAYAIKGPHLSPLGYQVVARKIQEFFVSSRN